MTEPLLEKSNQNMLIAEMLIKQNSYSSTVNRAYYSCLQFILHILIEKLNYTHKKIDEAPGGGTHSKAQYLLELSLINKSKPDYRWFQQEFPLIKDNRVLADYHGDPLNADVGYDSIRIAKNIITRLKQHY